MLNCESVDGKAKTISLDVINVTTSGEQTEPNKGGSVYRAFIYNNKLYLFRKQSVDVAQVFGLEATEGFNPLAQSITAEEVVFKHIVSSDFYLFAFSNQQS